MPALLTRMEMEPKPSSTDFTMRSTSTDLETSAWMATDLRPAARICWQTASAASDWALKFTATLAPALARARAIALPIPRLAPVTRATRFSRYDIVLRPPAKVHRVSGSRQFADADAE